MLTTNILVFECDHSRLNFEYVVDGFKAVVTMCSLDFLLNISKAHIGDS